MLCCNPSVQLYIKRDFLVIMISIVFNIAFCLANVLFHGIDVALNLFVNRLKCEQRIVGTALCAVETLWGQIGFQGHVIDETRQRHPNPLGFLM